MADESKLEKTEQPEVKKPKLAVVESDPTSVFDDLAALRKQSRITVTKRALLTNVPVDRPAPDVYFRVNPDPEMMLEAAVLKFRDGADRSTYYVTRPMEDHPLLVERVKKVLLVVTYSWPKRQIGIWPVTIDTGRANPWVTSAWAAYEAAKEKWVQMVAGTDFYTVAVAEGELPAPEWGEHALSALLKLGFKDKIVNHDGVPVMLRLRGIE